jgi:hypothetical protein
MSRHAAFVFQDLLMQIAAPTNVNNSFICNVGLRAD